MPPEPFVSNAKASPATRSDKGSGDENAARKEGKRKKFFPVSPHSLLIFSPDLHNFNFPVARRTSGTKTGCSESMI